MRARTKSSSDWLKPQQIEPRVKTTIAAWNTTRAPKRSATQPLIGHEDREAEEIGGYSHVQCKGIFVQGAGDLRQGRVDDGRIQVLHEESAGDHEGEEELATGQGHGRGDSGVGRVAQRRAILCR
jgi:hypothetical protein